MVQSYLKTKKKLAALLGAGMLFQLFGGSSCLPDDITTSTTTTLDTRTIVAAMFNAAFVQPWQQAVDRSVDALLNSLGEDDAE